MMKNVRPMPNHLHGRSMTKPSWMTITWRRFSVPIAIVRSNPKAYPERSILSKKSDKTSRFSTGSGCFSTGWPCRRCQSRPGGEIFPGSGCAVVRACEFGSPMNGIIDFEIMTNPIFCGRSFSLATFDMRIPEKYPNYRYVKISQHFWDFKNLWYVGITGFNKLIFRNYM